MGMSGSILRHDDCLLQADLRLLSASTASYAAHDGRTSSRSDGADEDSLPSIQIFLILIIIGGSFFSTSSGLRLLKMYILLKYSINEILSYSKPNNVFNNKLQLINSNIEQKKGPVY